MSNLSCARLFYNESKKNRLLLLHGKEVERKSCLSLKKFFECIGTKGDYLDEIRGKKKVSFGSVDVCSAPSSPVSSVIPKPRPAWVYTDIISKSDPRLDRFKKDRARILCSEFLYDVCTAFPSVLGPDYDFISLVRHFEIAIYNYYGGTNQKYFDKIQDITAAIAGRKKIGSLFYAIIDGQFSTPEEVIELPLKVLDRSFEGLPLGKW